MPRDAPVVTQRNLRHPVDPDDDRVVDHRRLFGFQDGQGLVARLIGCHIVAEGPEHSRDGVRR